jgi:hypothetical protein
MLGGMKDLARVGEAAAAADGLEEVMFGRAAHGTHIPLHHHRLLRQESHLRRSRVVHPVIAVRMLFQHPVRRMLGSMRDSARVREAEAAGDGPEEEIFTLQDTAAHGNHSPLRHL